MGQANKPIYDRRVNEILDGLKQGKSREALADEFGHSDYRSLDMYMRRRNFTWDKGEQTYIPKFDDEDQTVQQVTFNKTKRIIQLLSEGIDLDEVAEKVGFGDIETLGEYMTKKGYKWDAAKRTYIEMAGMIDSDGSIQPIPANRSERNDHKVIPSQDSLSSELESYIPSLEWLHHHLPQLQKLIQDEETKEHSQFPRYKIRGDAKVKSIQMALGLQAVANEFCHEFNIVQKEFYEVAVIECLIKYGYHFEVQNLLKNS